jgi:hypothetical protein
MRTADELFDGSDAHLLDDIPDAPDWVDCTISELREIAIWHDQHNMSDNAKFLRVAANQLEILAGAYETAKRKNNSSLLI